jgi:hypothetical protein
MAMTQAIAQAHLDAWLAADLNAASGQVVRVDTSAGSRHVTSADPEVIAENIARYQRIVDSFIATASGASGDPNIRLATWN